MANTGKKYKVTADKAAVKKKANSSSKTVTTIKKGTVIYVASTSSGYAKLAPDHKKINNKTVKSCYVSTSKIAKVPDPGNSTPKTNKLHTSHTSAGSLKATAAMDVYIRTSCDSNKASGIYYPKGTSLTITKICSTNGMYYVSGKASNGNNKKAWVSQLHVNVNNKSLNKKIKDALKSTGKNAKAKLKALKAIAKKDTKKLANKQKQKILSDIKSVGSSAAINTKSYAEKLIIKNSQGIHGMPYQFLPSVDLRLTNKVAFGRKYVERIVQKMPLLLFSPGKPDFAASFNKSERNTIIQTLISTNLGKKSMKKGLNKLLKNEGRYYTFQFDYKSYYNYVNQMLRYCSIVMGIGSVLHSTQGYIKSNDNSASWGVGSSGMKPKKKKKQKLRNFRWQNSINKNIKGFINSYEYVAFYVDSETSISESFDNSTESSTIADSVNSASSISKELQFLAGPVAGIKIDALTTDSFETSYDQVKDIADKYLSGSKLFKRLGEMFTTIGKGGKILFPELWTDSSFTKNYNISLKLRTPDGDKISWYLNILVPLIHLLALAAPHEMGPNGYCSPFLVRAFYKGIFNCDMGIITNIDISKGKEGAWSADGLPTEVDVTISLKDLYGFFAISKKSGWKFFQNTALLDYLCSSCGVNINKMEVSRQLECYGAFKTNQFGDLIPNAWLGINQGMSNLAGGAYRKIVKKNY